jgi:ribosomal protein L23
MDWTVTLIRSVHSPKLKIHALPNPAHANRTLSFRIDPSISKPELKSYLTKLYGLKIERIATVIRMGRFARDPDTMSGLTRTLQEA